MGVERALTRTRAKIALTFLNTCFAREASTASLFRILILSSRSDALTLRVCDNIVTGSVRRTSRVVEVGSTGQAVGQEGLVLRAPTPKKRLCSQRYHRKGHQRTHNLEIHHYFREDHAVVNV